MGFINSNPNRTGLELGAIGGVHGAVPDAGDPAAGIASTRNRFAPDLEDRVEQARQLFLARTRIKLVRATELVALIDDPRSRAAKAVIEELQEIAHGIAGTAGSFGYQMISKLAYEFETATDGNTVEAQAIVDRLVALVSEFHRVRLSRHARS